jgi:D-beta-D-heptose 7-phosphate kinase/D-beta-D-heptose 1-phosphate adenosyltransferase
MTPDRLARSLDRMRGRTIVVVGDVMLDEYVWGEVNRVSPDAPVQVVDVARRSRAVGGAGNVAGNVMAAGAEVRLVGVVGDDEAGATLLQSMAASGADSRGIVRLAGRPTTVKTRVMALGQQLIRLDRENRSPIGRDDGDRVVAAVDEALPGADALLVSDYAKGVLDRETLAAVVAAAERRAPGRPIVVDPKSADLSIYAGCSAITPNRREAEAATGVSLGAEADYAAAAERIRAVCGASSVLMTLGARGMALSVAGRRLVTIPSHAREVFDVTGAGDTVLAYFGLALAGGVEPDVAAEVANLAAGVKVSKVGAAAVTPVELTRDLDSGPTSRKVVDLGEAVALCERWRSLGRRVVFTNGCFDLLHAGHIHLLERARALGDALVVAVNDDASIRRLKGPDRPLVAESDRARILAALDAVDAVIVFEADTPLDVIRRLRPDVLVKGGDYTEDAVVGADLVRAAGGRVAIVPLAAGRSTTALLESIKRAERSG